MSARPSSKQNIEQQPLRAKLIVFGVVVGVLILVTLLVIFFLPEKEPKKQDEKKTEPTAKTKPFIHTRAARPTYSRDIETFEPMPERGGAALTRLLQYRWTEGMRLAYDFRFDYDYSMKENPAYAAELTRQGMGMTYDRVDVEMAIRCSGLLTVLVYKVSQDTCTLGLGFSRLNLAIDATGQVAPPEQQAEMARKLETEIIVEMSPRGKISQMSFDGSLSPDERNFLRAWVSHIQFVLPSEETDHWQEYEEDPTGIYLADYAVTGTCSSRGRTLTVVSKRKFYNELKISAPLGKQAVEPDAISVAQSGQVEGGIDGEAGCLARLAGQTDVSIGSGKTLLPIDLMHTTTTELTLREAACEPVEVAKRWAEVSARLSLMLTVRDFSPEAKGGLEEAMTALKVGDATFEGVLSELLAADQRGEWVNESPRAFRLLTMLFSKSEQDVQKALQLLLEGQYGGAVLQTIADALAECGAVSAQSGLLRIAADVSANAERRLIAILALASLRDAPAEAENVLRGLLSAGGDPRFADGAVLSLGLMGSMFSDLDRRGKLALFLEEAVRKEPAKARAIVEALGNIGAENSLGVIRDYLKNDDDALRAAAAIALRKLPGSEAEALMIGATRDSAVEVRRAAVMALRERQGEAIVRAMSNVFNADTDEGVRVEALKYFIDNMNANETALGLVQQAVGDQSEAVRELAAQALR